MVQVLEFIIIPPLTDKQINQVKECDLQSLAAQLFPKARDFHQP
jgi:hypothetical protein